jgi:hypothetical protein
MISLAKQLFAYFYYLRTEVESFLAKPILSKSVRRYKIGMRPELFKISCY